MTHLRRLVDDLLDVGRLTADKLVLNRNPVNLGEITTSAASVWDSATRIARDD